MIREGLLEAAGRRVDAAYAVHVYAADHPFGTWFGRPGHADGGRRRGMVVVHGLGGHGAAPERTRDPVPVACEIVLAFHTAVTRQFSVWDPVVLTVGKIAAGTVNNVIPDDARIEASLRTFSPEHRAKAHEVVTRLAQGIAAAHGLTAEVSIGNGYPVTVNDVDEQAFAQGVVVDLFGADRWTDMVTRRPARRTCRSCSRRCPGPTSTCRPAPTPTTTTPRTTTRRGRPSTTRSCRTSPRPWPRWRCVAPASSPPAEPGPRATSG